MKKEAWTLLPSGDPLNYSKNGQIVYLACQKLFGHKDVRFAFNQNSSISILIAPNGYGKTTLLDLLNGLITFSDYSKRPSFYERGHADQGSLNQQVRSALIKVASTPFGTFSVIRREKKHYRLCSFISEFILRENVVAARFIYSSSFYYLTDILEPDDLSCEKIDKIIERQKKKAKEEAEKRLNPTLFFDNLKFYNLSQDDDVDLMAEKVEANKTVTAESKQLFDAFLNILMEYGHFNVSDDLYSRMKSGFGDHHVKQVTDELHLWMRFGYIQIPPLPQDLKPSPKKDSAHFPGYWSRFARCSFWALLKYCGYANHYVKKDFLADAKSLFAFIKTNHETFAFNPHDLTNRSEFPTLCSSFGKQSSHSDWITKKDLNSLSVIRELLLEMSVYLQNVGNDDLEKWVDLIISHTKDPVSEQGWFIQNSIDGLWRPVNYEDFNPCYPGREAFIQPIISNSDKPIIVPDNQYETAWKNTVKTTTVRLTEESPELFFVDLYGENLYYFFDCFKKLTRFEKAVFDVTGLKVGLSDADGNLVFNKPSPDGRPQNAFDLKKHEFFSPYVGRDIMSSGERSILAILSSCFISSGYLEEDEATGLPIRFKFCNCGHTLPKSCRCILLDEPENSLHIAWQEGLLGALNTIIEGQEIQVIAATHSPSIIAGNEDWLAEELI